MAKGASIPAGDVSKERRRVDTGPHTDPDASILLLGIRGTGRTSLAILAANYTGFRLVDADQDFHQTTGLSRAAYAAQHGFDEYKTKELMFMRALLEQNTERCIIICGPGSAETTGQDLIRDYRERHAVIHIMRDAAEVACYLRTDDVDKISELSDNIGSCYRSVSNYEFFNISEHVRRDYEHHVHGDTLRLHPALLLKRLEHDFIRLIDAITNRSACPHVARAQHSLSHLPPEAKHYTYALKIALAQVPVVALDLRCTDLIADAVELVVDPEDLLKGAEHLSQSGATFLTRQYYALRRSVGLPVILHVKCTGLGDDRTWSNYYDIIWHGLRLAPEYLTLNLDSDPAKVEAVMARKSSTKIIGHFFDPNPQEGAWRSQARHSAIENAYDLCFDLVRVCQPWKNAADNIEVQDFHLRAQWNTNAQLPVIAYNTGSGGFHSAFINQILSPVTHHLLAQGTATAHRPLLTVQAAQKALYASFILDKLVFGIFGSAVNNSMSPVMHNAAFAFCGMPHTYQTFESPCLESLQHNFHEETFGGASITAPFKEDVISIVDYLSPAAQAIGAVNTLVPLRSRAVDSIVDRNHAGPVKAFYGDNTDWIGIHTCISNHLSPMNAVKKRTTALVLGAGGMARAAVYAALRLGVQNIFIWNRTTTNARKLIDKFDGKAFPVQNVDLAPASRPKSQPIAQMAGPATIHLLQSMTESWPTDFEQPTIIVSCISRAEQPQPQIVLPDTWLRSPTGGVVVELAYNPVDTPLVQQIRAFSSKAWIPVHGLQVLPEQGIAQFELFTGRKAPQHLMRAKIYEQVQIP